MTQTRAAAITPEVLSKLNRAGLAALAIAGFLIAGLAYNLLHTQADARRHLEVEFGRRAALAAHLTYAALSASSDQYSGYFGGQVAGLEKGMRAYQTPDADPRSVVLDAHGNVLVTWPLRSPAVVSSLTRGAAARLALRGHTSLSNLVFWGKARTPMVEIAAPFKTRFGRRVVVSLTPAAVIESFASAYLASAPAVSHARAYLIDGQARVLASSTGVKQGMSLPDGPLAAAAISRKSGSLGGTYFVSAPMPSTPWRVVFAAPRSALLAPVEGSTKRTAWELFLAFAGAVILLVMVGVSSLRKSAQLAKSREQELSARKLAHERLHDVLTGLPNRALFFDRTERALAAASRTGRALAVLFVDLDRFKRINDSLGHRSGDDLLAGVARRLRATVRPGDTVSRVGGDEFLVLCEDLGEPDDALRIAARVRTALEAPFELEHRQIRITCCIGIRMQDPGTRPVDAAVLVHDADAAMYKAKERGPGNVRVYDADLNDEALARLDTEVALRAAIANGELRVHYQPVVALPGGALLGVEALARWDRPGVGLVPPIEFIKLAEECGLIGELGTWVLETAMTQVSRWVREGHIGSEFSLSVNVSARQLPGEDLPLLVGSLLESWPLAPSALWLEITESAVMADPEAAARTLGALHDLGVRIAIDDFGTGQTSLDQLVRSLPVDILKLDRSFVGHMEDGREHAIVAAVAPMAEALDMTLIAEGVETAEQARELGELGYPLAQGYLFGRPVDADEFQRALAGELRPRTTS